MVLLTYPFGYASCSFLREEMPPIRPPLKRSIDSIESDLEGRSSSEMIPSLEPKEGQKYFEIDPSKVYLKITDIVRDLSIHQI